MWYYSIYESTCDMTLEEYKIVESYDNYLRVRIEGNDFRLMNSLRKIILSDIPSMAITSVYIAENTSSLVDEVLGNRIGLLYLFANDTDFGEFIENDYYDEHNSIQFSIDVMYSPKKNYVMSSDLIWVPQEKQQKYLTTIPRVVSSDVLLCKLAPGQQVKLEAYATKGIGRIHAKFNVVSSCYYKKEENSNSFLFTLEIENGMDPELILKRGIQILKCRNAYITYSSELPTSQTEEEKRSVNEEGSAEDM